jgi:hypothetical protein
VGEDVCIPFMAFPFVAKIAIHIFQELEVGVLLPSSCHVIIRTLLMNTFPSLFMD